MLLRDVCIKLGYLEQDYRNLRFEIEVNPKDVDVKVGVEGVYNAVHVDTGRGISFIAPYEGRIGGIMRRKLQFLNENGSLRGFRQAGRRW